MDANTAQVLDFPEQSVSEYPGGYGASPQTGDGFVAIANELFDQLLAANLGKREWAVMMAIIRKTYGYSKKTDDISSTQISEMTGISAQHCREAILSLEAKNMVTAGPGRYGKILGVNKDYTQWGLEARHKAANPAPKQDVPKQDTTSQIRTGGVPKRDGSPSQNGTHKRQPQQTIPNNGGAQDAPTQKSDRISFDNLPDGVSEEAAREWVTHRKKLRKAPTQIALDRAMKKAARAGEQLGIGADEAIYTAIEAGWQGIEVEWIGNRLGKARQGSDQPQTRSRASRQEL